MGKKKILVVDDQSEVGETTRRLLLIKGYNAVYLSSGKEALSWIQEKGQPDLVITDLGMPEMNGLQLSQRIKAINPKLPIVILTGQPELLEVGEGELTSGREFIDEVFAKPVLDIPRFLETIKGLIEASKSK